MAVMSSQCGCGWSSPFSAQIGPGEDGGRNRLRWLKLFSVLLRCSSVLVLFFGGEGGKEG